MGDAGILVEIWAESTSKLLGERVGPGLRESPLLTPSGQRVAISRNLGTALLPSPGINRDDG